MNRRIFAVALSLGVAALFAPGLALAEDHLAEAISHTKEAIAEGKAVRRTCSSPTPKPRYSTPKRPRGRKPPHTKEGITHLDAAIDEGKKKNAAAATGYAKEALTHLEAAPK